MIEPIIHRLLSGLIGRIIVGSIAVVASIRYGTGFYFWKETEKLERPSYTVIEKLSNGVELRKYEPYLIAETETDGAGFREAPRTGFRTCAGYIFGKNILRNSKESEKMAMTAPVRIAGSPTTKGEKMAMTAPVRIEGSKTKSTKVSFVIGSKYKLNTVPKPLESTVKIRQVPSHTLAVRSFSGPPPFDQRVQRERIKIQQALIKAGLKLPKDETVLVYGYHDPFITPNFLRKNEVALLVQGKI